MKTLSEVKAWFEATQDKWTQLEMALNGQRPGQFFMNALYGFDAEMYEKISGTDADPFYNEDNFVNFVMALYKMAKAEVPESPVYVMVKVGKDHYTTYFDEKGQQRFVPDPLLSKLVDGGVIDLNKLRLDYHTKKVLTQREYAEFHMKIGYTVSSFAMLQDFLDMEIINPAWEEELDTTPQDPV